MTDHWIGRNIILTFFYLLSTYQKRFRNWFIYYTMFMLRKEKRLNITSTWVYFNFPDATTFCLWQSHFGLGFSLYMQKLPFRGVLEKGCSENMLQTYRRTTMPKCDFSKVALKFYWNRTLSWVFSCKFADCFQNTFSTKHPWMFASVQSDCKNLKHVFYSFHDKYTPDPIHIVSWSRKLRLKIFVS